MGEQFEAFLDVAKKQGMKPQALPLAKEMFKMLGEVRRGTIDECLALLNKWLEITQFADRPDVKMLLSTIESMKEDFK